MLDHVLRPFRPEDVWAVHGLHARHAVADLVDACSTIEPVLDPDGVRHAMRVAEWAVVALDPASSVVGWGSLRSWTEDDGTRVYLTDGYVAPPARRRGLGRRLLREAEAVAAQFAGHTNNAAVMLGANASTVQRDRAALLERSGYKHVFSMADMEHDRSPVQPRRLPDGVTVRAATVADARALHALTARAWAGRPFFTMPTADWFRDWLHRSQLALFQVATINDRIVGFVAASRTPDRVEIEDVQVDPDLQRRGLATAMLTRTLTMLTQQHVGPVRLHTESHDPAGARSMTVSGDVKCTGRGMKVRFEAACCGRAVNAPPPRSNPGGPDAGWQTYLVPGEYEPPTSKILEWVAHHVHPRARVTAVAPLPGGITAAMDRISVDSPAGLKDVVLRRWSGEDWTAGLVAREASALAAVRGHGVPAPQLLAADEDGAETGVRCTLTSALAGQPDLFPADMRSWLGQLATTQAAIHAIPSHPQIRWDGWYDDGAPLDWLVDSGLRDSAREAAAAPLVEEKVLVHGDYQHFNVLWCNDRLSGVVDWPNAATGNRGSDVGHCRLNLAVLFDTRAAEDYLAMYERAAGVRVDRRADLRALLCFNLGWQRFIPHQVAGRAPLDLPGMPGRVAATIRSALDGIG